MKIISNFSNYSSVNFHQIYWLYVRISYTHAIKVLYCARFRTDTVHIAAVGVYIIKYLLPRVVCNYDMWWDYAQPNMCTICIEFTCAATRTIRLCRTYGSGMEEDGRNLRYARRKLNAKHSSINYMDGFWFCFWGSHACVHHSANTHIHQPRVTEQLNIYRAPSWVEPCI